MTSGTWENKSDMGGHEITWQDMGNVISFVIVRYIYIYIYIFFFSRYMLDHM